MGDVVLRKIYLIRILIVITTVVSILFGISLERKKVRSPEDVASEYLELKIKERRLIDDHILSGRNKAGVRAPIPSITGDEGHSGSSKARSLRDTHSPSIRDTLWDRRTNIELYNYW